MAKILNVISAVTPMGGTIAKLRVLMTESLRHQHFLYHPGFNSNREQIMNEMLWYVNKDISAYYGIYGRNIFRHVLAISRIVKDNHIDIVHFYFNYEQMFAPILKLLHPKVKFVRSVVGYIELSSSRKKILSLSSGSIDYYIYISEYIKKCHLRDFPQLEKKPSEIIYNCPVNVRKDMNISTRNLLLYVGGLNSYKNVFILIEMMNLVVNQFKRDDLILTIIGDGPDRKGIETLIAKYKIDKNVCLLGYRNDVAEFYSKTCIYLHPATNEGFGISVVEAMFMKCPCFVSDASALPELVDETCGMILPPHDALTWAIALVDILGNQQKLLEMGECAYNRAVTLFSKETFVTRHDELYSELIK